jgi:sugar/nucleoside kinase (ribokinase family)
MKILCIGHAAYDVTFPVETFPEENTKNRVDMRLECGGGPASNAAYLLGKWGMDTTFAGIVGNDEFGKKIKDEFANVKVDTRYLQISDECKTTTSFIIANKESGSRTIMTYRPSEMKMDPIVLDFEPDIILIDGQEYELSKDILNKYPNAISIIDAGRPTEEIIELSKMVDYVVCSKVFAETVTSIDIDLENNDTIIGLYNKMKEIFKTNIVVTLESKGCLYEYDNNIKVMPSIKVKPIDSTGAGDIFHGAFTYGIAKNMAYEKILKMSNIAGALSVTRIGGRYSIFSKEEMKEFYSEFE